MGQIVAKFDPYGALGVTPDAPDFVIQAAYRACIKKYHPDHYSGADARQRTADILEAYRLIGNADARSEFDRQNASKGEDQAAREHSSREEQAERGWQASSLVTPEPTTSRNGIGAPWLLGGAALLVGVFLWGHEMGSVPSQSDLSANVPPVANLPKATASSEPPPMVQRLPDLDNVIVFLNPADCEMSMATEKLFDNLIIFDPPTYVGKRGPSITLPGFDEPLVPQFTRKVEQGPNLNVRDNEATLAASGLWHGLRVSKIRVRYMEESSFWEHQIRFLEPAAKVRKTLNELGFNLPAIGGFREFTGSDVASAGIGVEELPGGSALTCGSSVYY
jgi:hypothetical protein